jgi:chitodextrinase
VHWNASTDTGGPGLGGYYIFRNGTQIKSVTASTTSYTDTTVTAGTQYTYTIEAYDTSNNVSAASSAASVTTPNSAQAPTISFNGFPTNALLHGTASYVNTTVTPTSGNTISQVQMAINGTAVKTLTSSPYNFTFSTTGYHDGSYTITITATDNHGNTGTASTTMIVTNGDLNSDRKVGITDLSVLAGNWNKTSAAYTQGDINGDGTVNVSDLSLLAGNWNTSW